MSDWTVTKTRFLDGTWEGLASGPADASAPDLAVTYQDRPVDGVVIAPAEGGYAVRIPVPSESVGDGIHTFVISDAKSGETLDHFTILAGEAVADTMRSEIELLRAELDLLKRAFRRHCADTA